MVCSVCGTRNLADESRCIRCGARMEAPAPVPEPVPERELTPAERLAVEARELVAAGDVPGALRVAQRAAVMAPDTFLCRLVLGDVYLHVGAADDALREFRRAAELDPESAEAKDKAELARRRLTHPPEVAPTGPRDWRTWLIERKQLVAIAAGVIAGLLVFAVGAGAIVSHTSPGAQIERAYRQQMVLGREHYKAGRYEDAARAFEQAARLRPGSAEAQRRLQDALAVAGLAPYPTTAPPAPAGDRMASIAPLNQYSPMPPRWVGPVPRSAQPGHPLTDDVPPPPPIPEPDGRSTPPSDGGDLPPPMPPGPLTSTADHIDGGTRIEPPVAPGIGTPAPAETPPAADVGPPTEQRKTGHILIKRHDAPAARASAAATEAPPPAADALRAEANRLRDSGQAAAAGQKYGEAAVRYRDEARQGGAGAAIKLRAATSCERAQQLCGTQGN